MWDNLSRNARSGIFLVACLCASVGGFAQSKPIPPLHPITPEQVQHLMNITHATARMSDGIHQMIDQQKKAMPYFPDAFWSDFEVEFAKLDWVSIATPIYQRYLSQEDAEKAIVFYSTEAGQHSLDSAMAVNLEMSTAGFEQGKAIGARLGEKYKTQIEENMRKAQQSSPTMAAPN